MNKKISEVSKLKLMNCNLELQILKMKADQADMERNRILLAEFKRLRCNPEKWKLDPSKWELVMENDAKTKEAKCRNIAKNIQGSVN